MYSKKCSLCSNGFYFVSNGTLTLRKDRLMLSFKAAQVPFEEISEKTNQSLKCVCHNCFHSYLDKPKKFMFEYNLGII